jgi:hypothetical protein
MVQLTRETPTRETQHRKYQHHNRQYRRKAADPVFEPCDRRGENEATEFQLGRDIKHLFLTGRHVTALLDGIPLPVCAPSRRRSLSDGSA